MDAKSETQDLEHWLDDFISAEHDWSYLTIWYASTKLETAFVKARAQVFSSNLEEGRELTALPFATAAPDLVRDLTIKFSEHASVIADSFVPALPKLTEFAKRIERVKTDPENLLDGFEPTPEFSALIQHALKLVLLHSEWTGEKGKQKSKDILRPALEARPESVAAIESLARAALCLSWSSFEILAADLWEDCVNEDPKRFFPKIMKAQGADEVDGLNQKQVSVQLLSQHDFDLRSVMGSVLKPKFDFTSVSGIELAYRALGGTKEIFREETRKVLLLVEKSRHLIQHRAGIVDSKFLKETGSPLSIGERLKVTDRDLTQGRSALCEAGLRLLFIVDKLYK